MKAPPEYCPQCGAAVPPNARACPDCGSDHQTGWSEEASAADLGLPDESFDYDRFVREEFGPPPARRGPASWRAWLVAAVVALILYALLRLR